MKRNSIHVSLVWLLATALAAVPAARGPANVDETGLDARVKKFLADHRGTWSDMNVPEVDGQTLYDLVVTRKYTRALENRHVHRAFGDLDCVGAQQDRRKAHHARHRRAASPPGAGELRGRRRGPVHRRSARGRPRPRACARGAVRLRVQRRGQGVVPQLLRRPSPEADEGRLLRDAQRVVRTGRMEPRVLRDPAESTGVDTTLDRRGGGLAISCKKDG